MPGNKPDIPPFFCNLSENKVRRMGHQVRLYQTLGTEENKKGRLHSVHFLACRVLYLLPSLSKPKDEFCRVHLPSSLLKQQRKEFKVSKAREREHESACTGSKAHRGLLCASCSLNRPWIGYRNRNENPRAKWQVTPTTTK